MRRPERREAGVRSRGRRATDFTLHDPGAASALHHAPSLVAKLALPLALVALVPSLVGLKLLSDTIHANGRRIADIQALRAQATKASRADSIAICRAVNTITRRDRRTILTGPARSVPILRKLGFTSAQVEAYEQTALAQARREAALRPLIAGGDCRRLPNPARYNRKR